MSHDTATSEHGLRTLADLVRWGAGRLRAARVLIGHSEDNAVDEARSLVLHALHLPARAPGTFAQARLLDEEIAAAQALIERRIAERIPAAYLIGTAEFAGLTLRSDARALVPRSPIAELIESGFAPWLDERHVERALDLCTGSGCIGIAMAEYNPEWQVDIVDISEEALSLARENIVFQHVEGRVEAIRSDLFAGVKGRRYDLIVSNPPYVTEGEYAALPGEYAHEPKLGLTSGADGLDLCLRLLDEAADHLSDDGLLIVEVGESEHALAALLPEVPFIWVEFKVGQMGVFALERRELVEHAAAIRAAARARHG